MERVVRERMTIQEIDKATPNALINIRPVVAAMKEFFGGSQLSQFMDQTNPLAELTSKRRLSALGPGGLSRERAGFDVRDVHHSHYGRICPIETPEGPNIGLIGSLATYGRINSYGFIETPYRKVKRTVGWDEPGPDRPTRPARTSSTKGGEVVLKAGEPFNARRRSPSSRSRRPTPSRSARSSPTRSSTSPPTRRRSTSSRRPTRRSTTRATSPPSAIPSRYRDTFPEARANQIEYMDVSPKQVVSVATALIPFLEHDDANRALMGSNMQRQAVPLLEPESPIVGTGMEERAARDSGQVLVARRGGVVTSVTAERIHDRDRRGRARRVQASRSSSAATRAPASTSARSSTSATRVADGQPIADSSSTEQGRARPRPERPRRVHELGGRQLRGRDRHQRPPRPRRPVHQHPHREARDRVARHQARARGDHPRHPERRRGVPQGPRRGGHRLHRRRGPPRRHPGRQDHAQGRDRADRRGAPPAGDLR